MDNKYFEKVLDELILGDTWVEDENGNVVEAGTCITNDFNIYKTESGNYRFFKKIDKGFYPYKEFILSKDEMIALVGAIKSTIYFLEKEKEDKV